MFSQAEGPLSRYNHNTNSQQSLNPRIPTLNLPASTKSPKKRRLRKNIPS
jgi:hypothetical protein